MQKTLINVINVIHLFNLLYICLIISSLFPQLKFEILIIALRDIIHIGGEVYKVPITVPFLSTARRARCCEPQSGKDWTGKVERPLTLRTRRRGQLWKVFLSSLRPLRGFP